MIRVIRADNLGDTPAVCSRAKQIIWINGRIWDKLPITYRNFILEHERGHIILNTRSEFDADKFASDRTLGTQPMSIKDSVKVLLFALPKQSAEAKRRIYEQAQRALQYDYFVNENEKALTTSQKLATTQTVTKSETPTTMTTKAPVTTTLATKTTVVTKPTVTITNAEKPATVTATKYPILGAPMLITKQTNPQPNTVVTSISNNTGSTVVSTNQRELMSQNNTPSYAEQILAPQPEDEKKDEKKPITDNKPTTETPNETTEIGTQTETPNHKRTAAIVIAIVIFAVITLTILRKTNRYKFY